MICREKRLKLEKHLWEVGPVLATCNGAFGMTSAALPLIFKLLILGMSCIECFLETQHIESIHAYMDVPKTDSSLSGGGRLIISLEDHQLPL